jgi:hypothetical protein
MIASISFFNTAILQSADVYEHCDLGVSLTVDSTEQDAFLGSTLKWDKIVVEKTKDAPPSNEYKPGPWSVIGRKIKVEHRYSGNNAYQAKSTPTVNSPTTLSYQELAEGTKLHLKQIQFTPERAGYTKETYRVWIIVPKLLKSDSQHAKDANGNLLHWSSYEDISITYAVPEFKLTAVKFTSDHGMLRLNVTENKPYCYNIGNAQTIREKYNGYTRLV